LLTFPQSLHSHYTHSPDRLALRLVFGKQADTEITYRDLIEKSAAFAQRYAEAGVKAGEVVVIILQHGESLVYAFWGAVLHGAIPSLLPWLTEKLSPDKYREDLAALVALTQPAAIVTYAGFEGDVREAIENKEIGDWRLPQVLVAAEGTSAITPNWATLGGMTRTSSDLVLLQHSSGSTGLQKGVAL